MDYLNYIAKYNFKQIKSERKKIKILQIVLASSSKSKTIYLPLQRLTKSLSHSESEYSFNRWIIPPVSNSVA